jgi:hypothetical protein
MQTESLQRQKCEEEELLRKRVELDAIRATLADCELELMDFRRKLVDFGRCYLRQSRIAGCQSFDDPSPAAQEKARRSREEARREQEGAPGTPPDGLNSRPHSAINPSSDASPCAHSSVWEFLVAKRPDQAVDTCPWAEGRRLWI